MLNKIYKPRKLARKKKKTSELNYDIFGSNILDDIIIYSFMLLQIILYLIDFQTLPSLKDPTRISKATEHR